MKDWGGSRTVPRAEVGGALGIVEGVACLIRFPCSRSPLAGGRLEEMQVRKRPSAEARWAWARQHGTERRRVR